MISLSLDDRLKVILSVFCQAYFGHVIIEKAIWSQLEHYCDGYLAAAENAKARGKCSGNGDKDKLTQSLIKVMTDHRLNNFPVSKRHQKQVQDWLKKIFPAIVLPASEVVQDDDEFIYKTFDRGDETFVTLLEENKDIIGHGTTGLTSWQGALFLADWCQTNQTIFKVMHTLFLEFTTSVLTQKFFSNNKVMQIFTFQIGKK